MISCKQHDYLEVICLYHYPIQLRLKSGVVVRGIAVDTAQDKDREECIKVTINDSQRLFKLDDIKSLQVEMENPHVHEIIFSSR